MGRDADYRLFTVGANNVGDSRIYRLADDYYFIELRRRAVGRIAGSRDPSSSALPGTRSHGA